jgi:hypothetical protein
MPLTFAEEIKLRAAFMSIRRERKDSLRLMFAGTQIQPKSLLKDAQALATEAKACKAKVAAVPGVSIPTLDVPSLNLNIFHGIDLRALINFRVPTLSLPDVELGWIPEIRIGSLPGFNLPQVRLNLKGILKFKDLLPDISLRALAYALAVKWPNLSFPSLMLDLSKILHLDFDVAFPGLRLAYPDFFSINREINLPHLSVPDVNLPSLPQIDLPSINLGAIDFSSINLPGVNLPEMIKVPGFDKVLRLLFELFDVVDLNTIIAELGAAFLVDFLSSALPVVQQIKSGAQAATNWGKAAQDWHKAGKTEKHKPFLLPGDARSACDAVAVLLRNSRDEHATLAAIQTTQLAASTAGLFVDLGGVTGPAVAAAAALAKTCQKVLIMGTRYKEMKNVNLILRTSPEETLSSNIFAVSPLLGCYYLANNTTSNVLNVLCDNIIEDGWMAQATRNKRNHLDPLMQEAQRFISESRYVLTPIRQNKGMYTELGFSEKIQQGAVLYIKKKLGRVPASTTVPTHRYIA